MLTKNQLGFLYMFLSVCTFSVMDLLVKWSSDYPTGEVLFFRGFFGLLPTYFLIPKNKLKTFYTTERSKEHLFRCLMGLMALIAIVVALRELPLAVVVSLSYAYDRLTTTAKGSSLNATTIAIKAIKPIRHLNKCSFDLSVV